MTGEPTLLADHGWILEKRGVVHVCTTLAPVRIRRRVFRACVGLGIDLIGFEGISFDAAYDRARNGVVSGNTIYNIDTQNNPAYGGERSAGGIYVDGGTGILIECNRVYSSNIGIEIASEHAGKATSDVTVRTRRLLIQSSSILLPLICTCRPFLRPLMPVRICPQSGTMTWTVKSG